MSQLQQSDLTYLGAFRLPSGKNGATVPNQGFGANAGESMGFNPAGNGGAGSLFVSGHVSEQRVAEVTIPAPVNSTVLASLNTATVLQNLVESTEGHWADAMPAGTTISSIRVGGLLVSGVNLIQSMYLYYDAGAFQTLSHFKRPLNLSTTGQVAGPYRLQDAGNPALEAGFFSGYMTPVPADHQAAVGAPALCGNCGLAIITRTSFGPAVFGFDPADLGVMTPVPASPLSYYTATHPLGPGNGYSVQSEYWNGGSRVRGMVMPTGFDSVLFFGRQGLGAWCYGTGAACGDPCVSAQGTHTYPYRYQIWSYALSALLNAANPWDITPDIWTFDLPFALCEHELGGVAYDPANRLIYLAQLQVDSVRLIIHVFQHKEAEMPKTVDVATQITTVPAGDFKVKTQLLDLSDTVIDEATSQPFSVPADPPSTPNVETPVVTVS
jgi:hypothetical protein